MKRIFAIPTSNGRSCAHFGHCQSFALVEVDQGAVSGVRFLDPPAHQPGSYPRFLANEGANVIIAGGMGVKAQSLFRENDIEVYMGVGVEEPRDLVERLLRNELETGDNRCDHGSGKHGHDCGD